MAHFRRGPADTDVPDWSALRDREAFEQFTAVVDAELRRAGLTYEIDGHEVAAAVDGKTRRLNLHALSRKYQAAESTPDRRDIIASHVHVLQASDPAAQFAVHPHPRSLLRLQLYKRSDLSDSMMDRIVSTSAPPGLVAAVAVEFDDSIALIGKSDLGPAGLAEPDLVRLAIDNVREQLMTPARAVLDAEGVQIHVLKGETDFQNVQVLWPDEFLSIEPELGALVAAPMRKVVIGCPVIARSVQTQIVQTASTAMKLYDASGGLRLSQGLYWYQDGTFAPVTIPQGEPIDVSIPPALQALRDR